MSEVKYISVTSPTLTLKINGKRRQAVNGVFEGLSDADMAELDKMIKTRPNIRVEVRKVDLAEAAAKVKAIVDKTPRAAIQGPVTSGTQASAILRDAKKKQESQILTGLDNAINTNTKPGQGAPLEVTQVPATPPPTGSFLGKFKS